MKTIVWDIDDVLNDSTRAWFETAWLPTHPACRLGYHGLTTNPPHELLGVSKDEYLASLDRFRLSRDAASRLPDKSLLDWFRAHGDQYRHIALTARPRETVCPALQWLLGHFGEWFQTFGFVPSKRPGQSSGQPDCGKADYLAWLDKADIFIDDSPDNCLAAKKLGIASFLVAQPWNESRLTVSDILELIFEHDRA
jgi:phosphoglycolate phosphatase-like HAD superfamily hydrolase